MEILLASPPHNGLLSLLLGKMPIPVQPLKGSGMKRGRSKVRKPCWRHPVVLPKFRFGEVGRAPTLPSTKHSKRPWHLEKEGTPRNLLAGEGPTTTQLIISGGKGTPCPCAK